MVTNTLVNAFFEDIKKTIKGEFVEAAIKLEKSYTKSSDIQTISSNILKTVKDILASMDIKPSDILKVAKEILYTNEKIAIFCILASVLIVNFIVLFYIWRNQRAINTSFELLAQRIQAIQIQNEPKAAKSSSMYPTTMFQTSQA